MKDSFRKRIFERTNKALGQENFEEAMSHSERLLPVLFWPTRKKRRRNIRFLFPELNKKERRDMEKRHGKYFALMRVHMARISRYTLEAFKQDFVVVEGADLIKQALEAGKGALVVGAHSGTWLTGSTSLAVRGFKTNVVADPLIYPPFLDFLCRTVKRFGINLIFARKNAFVKVREALGRGELVYLFVDLSIRPERSPCFPLLGASLPMDPGPALLALRQDVPVFWASCYHCEDQRAGLTIKREPSFGSDSELNTRDAILKHWAGRLEQDLHDYPEQWSSLNYVELKEGDQHAIVGQGNDCKTGK